MGSGETLRRNTVHNTNNNNNSGHNKQQQQDNEDPAAPLLTLPDDFREQVGSRPISPNVTVANRRRSQLKKFSQSTPALQLHHDLNNLGRYKSRQKKFLRLFPDVSRDECVLNYYACALVGDLLLQGHLYITYNYFAFHSNVFGYVTKTLIPVANVKKVTKEKTAKFIPNALGITTLTEKHLFSSLMSRDVTYRLAMSVWKKFHFPNQMEDHDCGEGEREIEISSQNGEHSSNDSFSHNSADPASVAIEEGTSTDSDVNDSAIEHSYSPTPEREEIDRVSALDQLSAASTAWASSSSSSYFFGFLTPRSSNNQDACDVSDGHHPLYSDDTPHERNANYWIYIGICFLLVLLCLSAVILWYRMYLLHSHLELRLAHSSETEQVITWPNSPYTPQMQELVDTLNLLLSSHSSMDNLKDDKEPTAARSM